MEEPLDHDRHRTLLRVCNQFLRGIITAEEACEKLLYCGCIEPLRAAEYIKLIPDGMRSALPAVLGTTPKSGEEWANFDRYFQFGGNDETWEKFVLECRVDTEAIRSCVLGEVAPVAASDFADRVRAVYRARLDEVSYRAGGGKVEW